MGENKEIEKQLKDNGDNTVTDSRTGLQWVKDHDAVPGFSERMTWDEAAEKCKNLKYVGNNDWRVPTREEMLSIIDLNRCSPAMDPIFTNVHNDWYRTSSLYAGGLGYAWFVYCNYGSVDWNSKDSKFFVRPVRSQS